MTSGSLLLAILVLQGPTANALPQEGAIEGERIAVRLVDKGPTLRGTLVKMTTDTVAVKVAGQEVKVAWTKIQRIEVGGDSLLNGSLIGAAVLGVYCAFICGQGLTPGQSLPGTVVRMIGLGAVVGAAFDASVSDRRVVYEAGALPGTRREARPQFRITVRF